MVNSFPILYQILVEHCLDLMELSCKFGNYILPYCKQAVNFYYYFDLEVVGKVVYLVFVEMVLKVADLNFEVEMVEQVEKKIVVEK